jgi:hypothetical protein
MGESLLKKEFKSRDVERARNLIKKDFTAKTTSGTGYEKSHEIHREGDTWEENGRTWTIKNGIKQNITKLDAAKKALQTPLKCPKCNGTMNYHLHQKMYKIHKMCFDCVVEYEGMLRVLGLYEQYEKSMIMGGVKAFMKDVEQWVMDGINDSGSYVTEQGDLEDWKHNDQGFKKKATENLQQFLLHMKKYTEEES